MPNLICFFKYQVFWWETLDAVVLQEESQEARKCQRRSRSYWIAQKASWRKCWRYASPSHPVRQVGLREMEENHHSLQRILLRVNGMEDIHRTGYCLGSDSKRFFLGTDSAPHDKRNKERVCACAGIYNAPVALSVYAKVFEEAGALDKLEAFTSFNGPDFYGLPRNTSKINLKKAEWSVPESIPYASGHIIPMFAAQRLDWFPSFD